MGSNRAPYLSVFVSMLPCDETIPRPAVQGVLTNIDKEKHGKEVDFVGRLRPIILYTQEERGDITQKAASLLLQLP